MAINWDVKDKSVIITGGAGGIGYGMATAFAKQGANLLLVDVNDDGLNHAKDELSSYTDVEVLNLDIAEKDNDKEIIDTAISKFGKLDVLINNAHVSHQKLFNDLDEDDFNLSFNTSFNPTRHLMKFAYPYLKKTKGTVINFASGAGLVGQPTQAAYAAAKEAIRGLSRTVANEWAPEGIRVNLISPIAETEGVKQWAKADPKQYAQLVASNPMKRLGNPETDIASVALFLASDASSYMTGQTLMVDGGDIKLR
ncbi:SDR family NAD(P)-dependent oxidoreductase [Lentilactobacillus sunkii]|nr:SDR family oxidoreductase [Lentilactobacillus sunkii]